ncbi:biopolymer transporter ExbD [Opitutaceae bacterium EW11]|nr:biopolymer transporter ExbD [Opitutaceae bacterium EW11]
MSGGGAAAASSGKKKARIEIIPLIDVIFFLLATFVLFTLSLNKIQSVPVNLPVATPSSAKSDEEPLIIQVSDVGTVYWNRELIGVAEIAPRLFQYKQSTQNPRVLVSGDDRAKFGLTIQVLDEIRKAGISQVSVETAYRGAGK